MPTQLRVTHNRTTGTAMLHHADLGVIWQAQLRSEQIPSLEGRTLTISGPNTVAIEADVLLGRNTRAVRLGVPRHSQVVQTGLGAPDSALNNAVYNPKLDLGLRFDARRVRVSRRKDGVCRVLLKGPRHVRITVEQDYFHGLCPHLRPGGLKPRPPAPGGWLSYYCHFERPSEKAILDDLDAAAGIVDYGMSFFLVEAWQRNANRQPVQQFHNESVHDREKFPRGMKWMAARIRAKGLRPGLWAVPLGTGNPAVYRSNPDMFLHDAAGRPIADWSGYYMFDPAQPAARRHIHEQIRIMIEDWGYEFLKLDGLSGRPGHYGEWLYAQPEVRSAFSRPLADPFRKTMQLMRRAMGSRSYFHACAAYYAGAGAGIPDGARTGGDVFYAGQAPSWRSVRAAAEVLLESLFTNRYLWHADPDVLCLRRPLSVDEARAWASLFGLTGVFLASSDKLATLPASRLNILRRVMPPADIYPMDLEPCRRLRTIWNLAIRRPFADWNVVGAFNWDEPATARTTIRFEQLGLDGDREYLAFDFWNRKFLGAFRRKIVLDVPPRACRVVAVHARRDEPQVIATNRHITQGGVSLHDVRWRQRTATLSGRAKVIGGDPYDLFVHTPPGLRAKCTESDAGRARLIRGPGPLVRLRLEHNTTGMRRWSVCFG